MGQLNQEAWQDWPLTLSEVQVFENADLECAIETEAKLSTSGRCMSIVPHDASIHDDKQNQESAEYTFECVARFESNPLILGSLGAKPFQPWWQSEGFEFFNVRRATSATHFHCR